jgi:hypothetical protein
MGYKESSRVIIMNPFQAYKICETRNCREPEVEKIITTDLYYSFSRAYYIIKDRFKRLVNIIILFYF